MFRTQRLGLDLRAGEDPRLDRHRREEVTPSRCRHLDEVWASAYQRGMRAQIGPVQAAVLVLRQCRPEESMLSRRSRPRRLRRQRRFAGRERRRTADPRATYGIASPQPTGVRGARIELAAVQARRPPGWLSRRLAQRAMRAGAGRSRKRKGAIADEPILFAVNGCLRRAPSRSARRLPSAPGRPFSTSPQAVKRTPDGPLTMVSRQSSSS